MTTFGLLIFPDVEELDFVGPWEVFTASSMLNGIEGRPADTVITIAEHLDPVRCAKGLRVLPDHTIDDHPDLDLLLVPGGQGTRSEQHNQRLLSWISSVSANCTWVTSVCTGALLLYAAGPGQGKRMATHWGFADTLAEHDDIEVVNDFRWVRDGNVVSSQGVSAGIDMALWLVGQIESPTQARAVQRWIQYEPAPPYQAEV